MLIVAFVFSFTATAHSCLGQSIENNKFNITGKIIGRDTGVVVLYYTDPETKNYIDTAILKTGEFRFTGKVNRISDAYIWTDTSNHNFSDPSVIRFLLEPGNIDITYDEGSASVKGSKSQAEKKNFDKERFALITPKIQFQKEIDSLHKLFKLHPDSVIREKMDELFAKIYSINKLIKPTDMQYIRSHPDSYVSAFLLSSYKRGLTMDTLQVYYSLLDNDVKSSTEGKKVLEYIYPLTDDSNFRNKNPIFGEEFNKKLHEAESVYDLSSKDTSGHLINMGAFKGQYLLIDFWASWCGPCIENFPFLEKLMKEYKSDPIQLISVSLDTRDEDWKKAITKYNLTGTQLSDLKGFNGILPVYCKVVTSIPRYVLINREGKIINYDAPHPMNPELKILIDNLLEKTN
jgi:thiol-disulfide isomerase/thioredoxin